jgi:hypothetical protein
MAEFLARRVCEGKLAFEDVPYRFKEQVRIILKEKYGMENVE